MGAGAGHKNQLYCDWPARTIMLTHPGALCAVPRFALRTS
jgi:hypothetical protein